MLKRIGNEKGFTLSEILVAITLLGVAMIGLTNMFLTSNLTYIGAGKETYALNLAQQKIEEIRSLKWDDIESHAYSQGENTFEITVKQTKNIKDVTAKVYYMLGKKQKHVKLVTKVSTR